MIIVTYSQTGAHQISEEIWQYDRGQSLRIEGLPELPGEPWIQFSLNKTGERQWIDLGGRKIRWIRLEGMRKSDDPSAFPSLRAWEVYGRECE